MKYHDGLRILLEARSKGLIDDFSLQGDDTWIGAELRAESTAEPLLELMNKNAPKKAGYVRNAYACPHCTALLNTRYAYCPWCGQALQWKKKRGHK